MGRCSHHDCTRIPSFNIKGTRPALYCKLHAEDGMTDVRSRRCSHGICTKWPSFNTKGSKRPVYCKTHAEDGMVNVHSRSCSHGICTKQPRFKTEGSKRAAYCKTHAGDGMVEVCSRRCSNVSCTKQPTFGTIGSKRAAYCKQHGEDGMIHVLGRRCLHGTCTKHPAFNTEGSKRPAYCKIHAADGMVDVCSRSCSHASCTKQLAFNTEGSKRAVYCKQHAADGMVNVCQTTHCSHDACTTKPSFNYEGGKKAAYCRKHAVDGMMNAVGGWAGPGYADLYDGDSYHTFLSVAGAEPGTITVSGNYEKNDDTALGSSTALFLYLHNENSESDFVRGQGEIDVDSGNFTATITDLPVGYSRGILSFVVLDPAEAGVDNYQYDTVFAVDVVNEGCSEALRIRLEWEESDYDFELWVTDPNGDRVTYSNPTTDIAYINENDKGGRRLEGPDADLNGSFLEYVVFSGLTGTAMLGEYRVFARGHDSSTAWRITATVNGVVEWVEEGFLPYNYSTYGYDDDVDRPTSRRLFSFDDTTSYDSYSVTEYPQSDVFTVTLDSYDPTGC